jgi:hypothetical protein
MESKEVKIFKIPAAEDCTVSKSPRLAATVYKQALGISQLGVESERSEYNGGGRAVSDTWLRAAINDTRVHARRLVDEPRAQHARGSVSKA